MAEVTTAATSFTRANRAGPEPAAARLRVATRRLCTQIEKDRSAFSDARRLGMNQRRRRITSKACAAVAAAGLALAPSSAAFAAPVNPTPSTDSFAASSRR